MEALIWVPLVGVIAGLLAGLLGIGGGLVIVPALLLVMHQLGSALPMQQAVATSLATIIVTGLVSTWSHYRRDAVRWSSVKGLAPGICFGAAVGAVAIAWLPGDWLRLVFFLFATWVGAMMMRGRSGPPVVRHIPRSRSLWVAPAIGAVSALVGIGGGSMVVPFLAAHGVTMQHAVGTASAIGVLLALAGAVVVAVSPVAEGQAAAHSLGLIHWPSWLAIVSTSVLAAPLGVRLAHRLPSEKLRRVFGGFLLLMAAWLALG